MLYLFKFHSLLNNNFFCYTYFGLYHEYQVSLKPSFMSNGRVPMFEQLVILWYATPSFLSREQLKEEEEKVGSTTR